jgi:hypothetical protein
MKRILFCESLNTTPETKQGTNPQQLPLSEDSHVKNKWQLAKIRVTQL